MNAITCIDSSTQHYVDGAVSDNLPRCRLKNTVTVSAYAGESDLCPPGSAVNFRQVRFNNVSIQVNSENLYRVKSTFFPPPPEVSHAGLLLLTSSASSCRSRFACWRRQLSVFQRDKNTSSLWKSGAAR